MKIKIYKKSKLNGHCPFCSSPHTLKGTISIGVKAGGNSNKYPEPNIEAWHCGDCKKQFSVFKEL